jgi:hypothetical protein
MLKVEPTGKLNKPNMTAENHMIRKEPAAGSIHGELSTHNYHV